MPHKTTQFILTVFKKMQFFNCKFDLRYSAQGPITRNITLSTIILNTIVDMKLNVYGDFKTATVLASTTQTKRGSFKKPEHIYNPHKKQGKKSIFKKNYFILSLNFGILNQL